MLRTRCIFLPPDSADGLRISIMSRHTKRDGRTPDPRITAESFAVHLPSLAPAPKLIGAFARGDISWEQFERRFNGDLAQPHRRIALLAMTELAARHDVTLLCAETENDRLPDGRLMCHRRLVAEACLRINPLLYDDIR